jgi:hypothetical protein
VENGNKGGNLQNKYHMNNIFKASTVFFLCLYNSFSFSQTFENVRFYDVSCNIAPENPKLKELKTFDVRLIKSNKFQVETSTKIVGMMDQLSLSEIDPDTEAKKFSKLLTDVSFKPMKQVESGGDLHVVILLQKYVPTTKGAFAYFYITLYDKYMNKISAYQSNWEDRPTKATKKLNPKSDFKEKLKANVELAVEDIMEYIYKISTEGFTKRLSTISLAQFEKVKKYPDLQDFNTIIDETQKVLSKEGANAWIKEISKDDLEYWGGFIDEKEDTESNDIKRVALHNLTVYHTLKNDEKKAREYLKKYQDIDVEMKDGALGEKYKASSGVTRLVNTIFPEQTEKKLLTQELSTDDILERHQYRTVLGEVIPSANSKVLKENFKGVIKIVNPEPDFRDPTGENNENTINIGGTYRGIQLKFINEKGTTTIVSSADIDKITSQDNKSEYVVKKFQILTFAYYIILERTYRSDKISLFQELFPEKSPKNKSTAERKDISTPDMFFWMALKGDSEGVQATAISMKKRTFDYLSTCKGLKDKYQEKELNPSVLLELVNDFEKCK